MQSELGSKKGLQLEGHTSDNDSNDLDAVNENNNDNNTADNEQDGNDNHDTDSRDDGVQSDRQQLENKFRMYYSRLLFYSFLSILHPLMMEYIWEKYIL